MSSAVKPKKFVRMMAKLLGISKEELRETLFGLPDLVSDENLRCVVDFAASGARGDDEDGSSEQRCRGILTQALKQKLEEVRPSFVSAAVSLREKLAAGLNQA